MFRNERHDDFLKNAWKQCTSNCAGYFSSTCNPHYSMKDRINNIDLDELLSKLGRIKSYLHLTMQ